MLLLPAESASTLFHYSHANNKPQVTFADLVTIHQCFIPCTVWLRAEAKRRDKRRKSNDQREVRQKSQTQLVGVVVVIIVVIIVVIVIIKLSLQDPKG
jgi:uncharacterized membrane protein YidH (DUF202 family)